MQSLKEPKYPNAANCAFGAQLSMSGNLQCEPHIPKWFESNNIKHSELRRDTEVFTSGLHKGCTGLPCLNKLGPTPGGANAH